MDKLSEKDLRNLALFNMALEKQMPKKPEFLHLCGTWRRRYKCPSCGMIFDTNLAIRQNPKYCRECGQAFDWGEGGEE